MAQLVGRLVWDQDAASSSLATRTKNPDSAYAEPGFLLCLGRLGNCEKLTNPNLSKQSVWFHIPCHGFIFKRNHLKPCETISLLSNHFKIFLRKNNLPEISPLFFSRKPQSDILTASFPFRMLAVFSIAHEFYRLQHQNNR